MAALYQQNGVLERDIHTCNYERINLTQQLHESRERLEKLTFEINKNRLEKEQRTRKSMLPALSKDSNSVGGGTAKATVHLKSVGGSNRQISATSLSSNHPAHQIQIRYENSGDIQDYKPKYEGDHPTHEVEVHSEGPKKKRPKKYDYVNGKLQGRFALKKE
jgi:hypothetical protein